ncbi:hypothetical protein C8A05DRAFT_11499 [Staphylotrichum tortipilum]|uniref:Wax synthase domain-containing protein n=1 Tax=Staphylotrichum tortipilum TaxID=2831512 RepID=A0AAN6RYH0_9PEZI|nr:hypothetical protein C8A05DRAFT_11499 [Staphylotrichum longicolle]
MDDTTNTEPWPAHQQQYQAAFHADVAADILKPLVFPWSFIGSFFIPLAYLSIPHVHRPWLFHLRWAVAAAVIAFNIDLAQTTSSGNEAVAYATGLLAVWGSIWALRLLIFTRPQWDAARVEQRPRGDMVTFEEPQLTPATAPDESVAAALTHSEYVWQPFPAKAPLLTRLAWTADLLTAWRGAGWNFAISSLPHPPRPPKDLLQSGSPLPVRLDLIPPSPARSTTYAAFLRSRLTHFALSYLTIDILTSTMRSNPYFVHGPDPSAHHTSYAEYFDPRIMLRKLLTRNLPAFVGIMAGLHLYASALQLLVVFPLRRVVGVKAELWMHPTLFGEFWESIGDRGLSGLWGVWWHQTFRAGFVAPGEWIASSGLASEGAKKTRDETTPTPTPTHPAARRPLPLRLLTATLPFLLSGLLHAAGSFTSAPSATYTTPTRPIETLYFFANQPILILMYYFCTRGNPDTTSDRSIARASNFFYTTLLLNNNAMFLIDDMSRASVWLFEPVPLSPLRLLGLGPPGEGWWRWGGGEYGFSWYSGGGGRWWEAGVRL